MQIEALSLVALYNLDGFTFSGGQADGEILEFSYSTMGAAIYHRGKESEFQI